LAAYAVFCFKPGGDSISAAAILALSIALDFFILQKSDHLAPQLSKCEITKVLFLAAYVFGGPLCRALNCSNWVVPTFGRLGGVLALGVAGYITFYMLRIASDMSKRTGPPPASPSADDPLITELLGNKMLAVAGVLVAFLHVTYAMTFALAFSDGAGKSDLFAHRYVDEKPAPSSVPPKGAGEAGLCETTTDPVVRRLFFAESAATLSCTEAMRAEVIRLKRKSDICDKYDLDLSIQALDNISVPQCDGDPLKSTAKADVDAQVATRKFLRHAAAWNVRQLHELSSVFRQLAWSGKGTSYQIEIRGHANDTKFKTSPAAYASDHEISKQRADQVERVLGKIFRDATSDMEAPAVRWLSYGVSNEEEFLDDKNWPLKPKDKETPVLDKKLSAEIQTLTIADSFQDRRLRSANPGRRTLNLTDYLYFTVYTITTTGYGDIIPISSYAKFVVTIANLMELLFIVLIVNLVANARQPRRWFKSSPRKEIS